MSLAEYKDIFVSEAKEYLKTLNNCVLDLEKDPENVNLVEEMFRAAHSLKGMAGTMGFDQIASLTHQMESVFDEVRNQKIKAEKRVVNLLFESLDLLENLLSQVEEGEEEEDVSDLVIKLGRIMEAESGEEKEGEEGTAEKEEEREKEREEIKRAKEKGEEVYLVTVKVDKECLLKSVRAYMVVKEVKDLGSILKSMPGEEDLEAGTFADSFQMVVQTSFQAEDIKSKLEGISEIEKVTVEAYEAETPEPRKKKPSLLEEQQKELLKKTSEKIIRVETEKLDALIGLVGELVVNRTRVLELSKNIKDSDLKNSLEQLDLITTNLQNAVMKLRMVPIKQVFDRFPRLVRDFSQSKSKKVNLVIEGEETELDRSIVNIIGEPLVHLVRNAMDHGIERASDRKHLNKKDTATIKLSARHEGSHVIIEVEDDGCGIDPRKIKTKATEKGLKAPQDLEKMSNDEIIKLIFHSGFSTSEEVTDVSGRGVGMDAVKSTIEALHGEINVDTRAGKGSRFIIKLPLTLAIIKAMLVKIGGDTFAIPVESIRENVYVSSKDINTVQNQKVISFREEILRLVSLRSNLRLGEAEKLSENGVVHSVIVVEAGDRKAGFLVDELIGQQEIVIKSLGKILEGLRGIAGATVLANGEVALILDVSSLV